MALEALILQDQSPADRLELLTNTADTIRDGEPYTKHLTEEELIEFRREKLESDIKIAEELEKFKVIKNKHTTELKPMKIENDRLLTAIRDRAIRIEGQLFGMCDHDSKRIGFYNELGELVSSRKMTPEEQQGNIHSSIRISSGN